MVRTYVKVADRGKKPKMTDKMMVKLQKERLAGTISEENKKLLENEEVARLKNMVASLYDDDDDDDIPVEEPKDGLNIPPFQPIWGGLSDDDDEGWTDDPDTDEEEPEYPKKLQIPPFNKDFVLDNMFNETDSDDYESEDDELTDAKRRSDAMDALFDDDDDEDDELDSPVFEPDDDIDSDTEEPYTKEERRELTLLKIFGETPPRRDETGRVILPKASISMSKKGSMLMGDFSNPSMTQNPVSTPKALKKARKLTIDTVKPPAKPPRRRKKATKNMDKTRENIISGIKESPVKPKKRRKKATKNMDKTRENIMTGLNAY